MNWKLILTTVLLSIPVITWGHCQVPCGIYDDALRIVTLKEHVATIEKAMQQITTLWDQRNDSPVNYNQINRWVTAKENHASAIQELVTDYFLTQRIKPKDPKEEGYESYVAQTLYLQQILVMAMKGKQTLDLSHMKTTRNLIEAFVNVYFDEHGKEHLKTIEMN